MEISDLLAGVLETSGRAEGGCSLDRLATANSGFSFSHQRIHTKHHG